MGIFEIIGLVAGGAVGYGATRNQSTTSKAVAIGLGIIGGAVVGWVVDEATGV